MHCLRDVRRESSFPLFRSIAGVLFLLWVASVSRADVWYVDGSLGTNGSGTTVLSPFNSIVSALAAANDADEVRIAGGTYAEGCLTIDKAVEMRGGFDSNFVVRDIETHATILDGEGTSRTAALVVVTADARLDGLTVTRGCNSVEVGGDSMGGGIYIKGGSSAITSCSIVGNLCESNWYLRGGAGICVRYTSASATIANCVIRANRLEAAESLDVMGAGVVATEGASVDIEKCRILENTRSTRVIDSGVGVSFAGEARLVNCVVVGSDGAAVALRRGGLLDVVNTTVVGGGYGVYLRDTFPATATLTNSIIHGTDRGIYGYSLATVRTTVRNCLFHDNGMDINWDNVPAENPLIDGGGNITTSPLLGGSSDTFTDPRFLDPVALDFRIRPGSAAIDAGASGAGIPDHDLLGAPRDQDMAGVGGDVPDSVIDIGAYEYQTSTHTLLYTASAGGHLAGDTHQVVLNYEDGSTVTAIADAGSHFVRWSDGSFANPRRDMLAASSLAVEAQFATDSVFTVWYVDGALGTNGAGTSPGDALNNIQDAIARASGGDKVWITGGTYAEGVLSLDKQLTLAGGFNSAFTARDIAGNPTIIDGQGTERATGEVCIATDSALDGLTITGGENETGYGGGIEVNDCSPTITSCTITGNNSDGIAYMRGGGGIGIRGSAADPTIVNCLIEGNTVDRETSTVGGGGILLTTGARATFKDCKIVNNGTTVADNLGGLGSGVLAYDNSNGTFVNCVIAQGRNAYGAIASRTACEITVTNCTIDDNQGVAFLARSLGGNIIRVTNTIVSNHSDYAFYNYDLDSEFRVQNCLFHNNGTTASDVYVRSGNVTITDLGGNVSTKAPFWGAANQRTYPRYTDPSTYDYSLNVNSAAIDRGTSGAGIPTDDINGAPRGVDGNTFSPGGANDIGAYEFQSAGSWDDSQYATVYIRPGGTGDGSTWANAAGDPDAVDSLAGTSATIWVAAGLYTTDDTIEVKAGQQWLGGFPNTGTPGLADRDPEANETILRSTGGTQFYFADAGDVQVTIDGFIMERGGVSLNLYQGEGDIRNCVFRNNTSVDGCLELTPPIGGISISRFTNCKFLGNTGGGTASVVRVYLADYAEPGGEWRKTDMRFTDCVFASNITNGSGRAAGCINLELDNGQDSRAYFERCAFAGNQVLSGTEPDGGAIKLRGTWDSVTAMNCAFVGNSAAGCGGALRMDNAGAHVQVANCTFVDNEAETSNGGGIAMNSIDNHVLFNNIFSGNVDATGADAVDGVCTRTCNLIAPDQDDTVPDGDYAGAADFAASTTHSLVSRTYDSAGNTTTLVGSGFTPGALVGRIIKPDATRRIATVILSNTATDIVVPGDFSSVLSDSEILDLMPMACSMAIDHGVTSWAGVDAPAQDIRGTTRPGDGIDIGAWECERTTFTLTYTAGAHGSLSGQTFQIVYDCADGSPVQAIPDTGYRLDQWSDGSTANPRQDTRVTTNIAVQAHFEPLTVLYVDGSRAENGSGTLASPFNTLAAALAAAGAGDEIRVAGGTYYETVDMQEGLAIRGGYAPDFSNRDLDAYETVIDGERTVRNRALVLFDGADGARLDGVTVANGLSSTYEGGGVFVNCQAQITSCVIKGNTSAGEYQRGGGGVYVSGAGADALVQNCRIFGNNTQPCILDGAYYNYDGGGGICAYMGRVTVLDSRITSNSSGRGGGVLVALYSDVTVKNCVIARNMARNIGAAILLHSGSELQMVNTTVDRNRQTVGDTWAIAQWYATTSCPPCILGLTNCIISNHQGYGVLGNSGDHTHIYSHNLFHNNTSGDIEGVVTIDLGGNISKELFGGSAATPTDPDYLDPDAEAPDYRLGAGSAAIDAGLTSDTVPVWDLAGAVRPVDVPGVGGEGLVNATDIGAYEHQLTSPTITRQPVGKAVAVGQPACFAIEATGSGILQYAWEFQPVGSGAWQSVGSDSPSLEFPSAQVLNSGTYRCTVSNFLGSEQSNTAVLNVVEAPVVTSHPADASVAPGETVELVTEATGGTPLLFVWKKGDGFVTSGGRVSVATSGGISTLTISSVETSDADDYGCVVSNIAGSAESEVATIHITGPVTIVRDPVGRNAAQGTTVTLRVGATGTLPLAYQWYRDGLQLFDGGNVSGSDSASLILSDLSESDEGTYHCHVSNSVTPDGVDSSGAALNVLTGSPPATPMGLGAMGGVDAIALGWNANTEANIVGYHVYRDLSVSGAFETRLTSSPVTALEYEDGAVLDDIPYYYRLTALNDEGLESAMTDPVSARKGVVSVWMADYRGAAGTTATLRINCSYADGIAGYGMDVRLTYDESLLTPVKVSRTVLTTSFNLFSNHQNGQLYISGLSSAPTTITGAGRLLEVDFLIDALAVDATTASHVLLDVTLYDCDAQPLQVDHSEAAIFTVANAYMGGDVNGDGTVDSADAILAQQHAVGLRTLLTDPPEFQAADMNGDGVVDSADVTLILRRAVGLPLNPPGYYPSRDRVLASRTRAAEGCAVSLPSGLSAASGATVQVPVSVSETAGIAAADLMVTWDSSVLSLQSVSAGSAAADFTLASHGAEGYVRIAMSRIEILGSGSGDLAVLTFSVVGDPGDETPLNLPVVKLSGQYGENLAWSRTVTATGGQFLIDPATTPTPTPTVTPTPTPTVGLSRFEADQKCLVTSDGRFYALLVHLSSGAPSVQLDAWYTGELSYSIEPGEWVGAYLYDYDSAAWSRAVYFYDEGL